MDIFSSFIVYLIIYRVSIVLAGVLSIYWGYLLFVRLSGAKADAKAKGTDAEVTVGKDIQLKLTNAAPGTVFALFGAGVIIAMIAGGSPMLTLESMKQAAGTATSTHVDSLASPADSTAKPQQQAQTVAEARPSDTPTERQVVQMRGDEFDAQQQQAIAQIAQGKSLSRSEWQQAAAWLAQRFNKDAWQQYKAGDHAQALFNAELALRFVPGYYNALDTKAEVLHAQGKTDEAKRSLQEAIAQAPENKKAELRAKLAQW